MPVSPDGKVKLYTQLGTHLVADVVGWYTNASAAMATAGLFEALTPARILDTRTNSGHVYAGGSYVLNTRSLGGLPPVGYGAIVANVTATQSDGPGFITVWPAGIAQPVASNLNRPSARHFI